MGYFGMTYYDSLKHSDTAKKRDLNGTSVSDEKGTDNKANNTSAYNHEYYMKNKDKWGVKEGEENSEGSSSNDKEFDLDAAALDVIRGKYGNGQARKDALGDDFDMVQKRVNEMYAEGRFGGGSSNTSSNEKSEEKSSTKSTSSVGNNWYNATDKKIMEAKKKQEEKNNK